MFCAKKGKICVFMRGNWHFGHGFWLILLHFGPPERLKKYKPPPPPIHPPSNTPPLGGVETINPPGDVFRDYRYYIWLHLYQRIFSYSQPFWHSEFLCTSRVFEILIAISPNTNNFQLISTGMGLKWSFQLALDVLKPLIADQYCPSLSGLANFANRRNFKFCKIMIFVSRTKRTHLRQ